MDYDGDGRCRVQPASWLLQKHNFSPMEYAMWVHGGHSAGDAAWADLRYILDPIAYVVAPVAILLLAVRPRPRTIVDMAWPADADRRLLAVAFWATLLLPTLPALFWGIEITGYGRCRVVPLPVLLLSPQTVQIPHPVVRRIVGCAVAFPMAMLMAAPAIALVIQGRGVPSENAHIRILAERVESAWHDATTKPLHYVGGVVADGVLTYVQSRPEILPNPPRLARKTRH